MIPLADLNFSEHMSRGGVVMWPLLGLSMLAVTLILERSLFYLITNGPVSRARMYRLGVLLRAGRHEEAREQARRDHSVYGHALRQLLDDNMTEAAAIEAIETQRGRIERFLPVLSTIITAAPMLGILGTVIGIIGAFGQLEQSVGSGAGMDLNHLGGEIGQALVTTAAGISVALFTLLPYNLFRAQADRSLSRLESLATSALSGCDSTVSDT